MALITVCAPGTEFLLVFVLTLFMFLLGVSVGAVVPLRMLGMMTQPSEPRMTAPTSVKVTVAMLGIEVLGVAAALIMSIVNLNQPGPLNMAGRIFMLVLIAAAGAGLLVTAVQHYLGKAFTRAIIVVWQLFQIIIGAQTLAAGGELFGVGIWMGIAMVVTAGVALVMVFAPATRLYLSIDDVPR